MSGPYLKDPAAVIDYSFDWAANYLAGGENITSSSWSILPAGDAGDLSIDSTPVPVAGVTSVFVAQGIAGKIYQLTNHITTDQGRTDERSVMIRVEDK